jgi:GNAT superfamily N-acetyltransferase
VPKFEIRKARVGDIEALVQQRREMFAEMPGLHVTPEGATSASDSYRTWAREMMKKRLFHGYVVTTGRREWAASGCVWLREVQPSHSRPARLVPYVMSIYTVPRFRRNGLASLIVEEAMKWAKRKGYEKMTLHASTVGKKVYSKLGWERTWEMEVRLRPRPPSSARRAPARKAMRSSRPSRASRQHLR